MKPLALLEKNDVENLRGVFFDLDDTLLTHGVLTRVAYDALWSLHDAGLALVAVTGRPSGWGELLVRQWPIRGAVTENGAIHIVRTEAGVEVEGDAPPDEMRARRMRLDAIARAVAKVVPEAPLTDDTSARRADIAWDIGEKCKVAKDRADLLARVVAEHGARSTRSSVHAHATFSRDDKASGAVRFAEKHFGQDAGSVLHTWAFLGDSGNDAPCFAAFRKTFGVANVTRYVSDLNVTPRWIAEKSMGDGFAEIAAALLERRGARVSA